MRYHDMGKKMIVQDVNLLAVKEQMDKILVNVNNCYAQYLAAAVQENTLYAER